MYPNDPVSIHRYRTENFLSTGHMALTVVTVILHTNAASYNSKLSISIVTVVEHKIIHTLYKSGYRVSSAPFGGCRFTFSLTF